MFSLIFFFSFLFFLFLFFEALFIQCENDKRGREVDMMFIRGSMRVGWLTREGGDELEISFFLSLLL